MRNVHRHWLLVIIAGYLLCGTLYSVTVPVFEAPDEEQHYGYVQHLASERELPPRRGDCLAGHESSQPPLYYAVAALGTAWSNPGRAPALQRNSFYGSYEAPGRVNDNKNVFLHDDGEAFPWRDAVLAVQIARFVNLLFGAVTVGATYLLAREVFGKDGALALYSAAIVACVPQFLFISSAVNNDIAAGALSTATLWLLAGGIRRGFSPRRGIVLGLAIGLAALSKVNALALLPLALSVVGLQTWRSAAELRSSVRFRRLATRLGIVLLTAFAVSGWWYIRNAVLYEDPLGLQTHFETWWRYEDPLPLSRLWGQLPGVILTFWAAFGMGNIQLPTVYYTFMGWLLVTAVVGLALWAIRAWRGKRRQGPRIWSLVLLTVWLGVVSAALLRWMQLVKAALGRLLFPAIGAVAILLVWGFAHSVFHVAQLVSDTEGVQSRPVHGSLAILVGLLVCVAVAAPFIAIRPAYARPPLLSEERIADQTKAADITFGDGIRLAGYRLDHHTAYPGEDMPITLCWEALHSTEKNYAYFVHLLGVNNRIVGGRDTYPGLGRFPTSQWKPGDAFCDSVRVPVSEDAPTQAVYDVETGWYEPRTGRRLPAYGPDGHPMDLALLDRVTIMPERDRSVIVPRDVNAHFEDKITLLGYGLSQPQLRRSESLTVTLYWKAQATVSDDYTAFVHLAPARTPPYAQDDSQPRNGTYPTSVWEAGEVVVDPHVLQIPNDLPAGDYVLSAGMYLLETGERLTWLTSEGTGQSDHIPLETLTVETNAPSVVD